MSKIQIRFINITKVILFMVLDVCIELYDFRLRGIILSAYAFSSIFGIVIGFSLSAFTNFHFNAAYLAITSLILFAVIFYFFPETPSVLFQQNKFAVGSKKENSFITSKIYNFDGIYRKLNGQFGFIKI